MINIFEVNETNKNDRAGESGCAYHYYGYQPSDCIDSDLAVLNEKIYKKITTCAKDLVSTVRLFSVNMEFRS